MLIGVAAIIVGSISYRKNRKAEMKNKNFWPAYIFVGVGAFMFIAPLCLLLSTTPKIKNLPTYSDNDLTSFLQGKWMADNSGKSIQYKIEIVGNNLKLYERLDGSEWSSSPTAQRPFTLGGLTLDYDKYYHVRYLQFDNGDLPMSFRAVGPIWVVCDEKWGAPALLYGGGFTAFRKGW